MKNKLREALEQLVRANRTLSELGWHEELKHKDGDKMEGITKEGYIIVCVKSGERPGQWLDIASLREVEPIFFRGIK